MFFIHCSEKWPDGVKKMASSGGAERVIHAKVRIVMSSIFVGVFFPKRENKRLMFNLVVFLVSPASCLLNLLGRAGRVTFDFCDISRLQLQLCLFLPFNLSIFVMRLPLFICLLIHSFRQRSHVVPVHAVQVRDPPGTNMNTIFFQAYPR